MSLNKVNSMTAYGRVEVAYSTGTVIWEIRSVNHRYLEPHFRLPEVGRALEPQLRQQLRASLARGKLELSLNLKSINQEPIELQINQSLVSALVDAATKVASKLKSDYVLNPLEIMQWPGVIGDHKKNSKEQHSAILDGFNRALVQVSDNRAREGSLLASFIEDRLTKIEQQLVKIRSLLPQILATQRQQLHNRVEALVIELDKERLEQEVFYLLSKADMDEELDRLDAHIKETRRALFAGGPIGRRLDFLMQEFTRETNTLSAKSVATEVTQLTVEIKVLIEQMREQVQNIE